MIDIDGIDRRIKHKHDPCIYCGKKTIDVEVGACRAFDGVRPPMAGERFIGLRGEVTKARFDFSEQKFAVFKD